MTLLRSKPLKSKEGEEREEARPNEYYVPAVFLAISLFLFGVTKITSPQPGLDPSWRTGINLANETGLDFGRDIIFTYGPLGFLDTAQSLSVVQMTLSIVFALVATASLWTVLYVGIAKTTNHITAGVITTVMVGIISGSNILIPSLLMLIAASILTMLYLKSDGSGQLRWTPPAVTAMAAVVLQVKFSEGVVLIVIAALCSIFAPSQTLSRIIESAVAFLATFSVTWLLTGQSIGDVLSWVRGSLDIAVGFSEAMGYEIPPDFLSYLVAAASAVAVLLLTMRWTSTRPRRARLGVLLVALCLLYFSYKQGFTRHDAHERTFFAVAAALLATVLVAAKRQPAIMGLLAVTLVFSSASWSRFDPIIARDAWKTNVQLLRDPSYRQQSLQQAALGARSYYALPPAIVSATKGHPVTVDPWEATMAWAYDFTWRPVPIFQSYSAYTARLDQINADAIVSAPSDQVVIRARPGTIDGRNPMWESPRYLLGLACNYDVGPSDDRWMTLTKADQKCSAPAEISTVKVEARQRVALPQVPAGQILVGHFSPYAASLPSSVWHLLTKDGKPLRVNTQGVDYRLPKRLADGPLLLHLPESLGWPDLFGGNLDYKDVAFSHPGTLTLETVTITR